MLRKEFNKSLFGKNKLIEFEINGILKKGKIIGLNDHERFEILNLRGERENIKMEDVKIKY